MDVRCSRCGVEYEFDEDKVKPTGVTVKCTSCGHVFKVKPPSQEESAPLLAAPNVDGWMVRHRDGTVMRFKELTTLQKWIVEQKVSSADEISRTGRTWRPLGDIAELASFFEVVEAANAARRTAELERGRGASVPPPTSTARDSDVHTPPPGSLTRSAPSVAPVPPPAEASFYGEGLDDLDDEDPVAAWRRRGRRRNAALAVLLLVVVAVAGVFFFARPTFDRAMAQALSLVGVEWSSATTPADPASDALVTRALASLKQRAPDASLVAALEAAAEPDDAPAAVVAALSRVRAVAALRVGYEVALLEKKQEQAVAAGQAPSDADKATLDAAKKRATDALAAAYTLASRARAAAPDDASADLAFATYQAVKGAVAEARADLDAAVARAPSDASVASEAKVLAALAASVAAKDDAARAQAKATVEQALQEAPGDARLEDALAALQALLGARADDAKGAEASDAQPAEKTEEPQTPDPAAKPTAADDDGDDEAAGAVGYDELLKQAERARVRERTSAALKLYKRAADERPQAARPHVGMGWCYLDLDRTRQAADAFAHAITLDRDLAEAHFGLAEAQRYSGKKAAALRAYKRYLELAPAGPDASVARNAIQALEEESP